MCVWRDWWAKKERMEQLRCSKTYALLNDVASFRDTQTKFPEFCIYAQLMHKLIGFETKAEPSKQMREKKI